VEVQAVAKAVLNSISVHTAALSAVAMAKWSVVVPHLTAKLAPILSAVSIEPPAALSTLALSTGPALQVAAHYVGSATAFALGSSAIVCVAFPPKHVPAEACDKTEEELPAQLEMPSPATPLVTLEPPLPTTSEDEEAVVMAKLEAALPLELPKLVSKPPPRKLMRMVVSSLPEHVPPTRLLLEFPQALQVEALYHKASRDRTSVVLTFDANSPPDTRTSSSLGASLHTVVHAPEASTEYSRSVWKRGVHSRQGSR